MAISYIAPTTMVGGALECHSYRLSSDGKSYELIGARDPTDILQKIQSLIDASRNQVIEANPRPYGYFGCYSYYASAGEQVPKPATYETEVKLLPNNSNFKERQRSGEIVVSNATHAKIKLKASASLTMQSPWQDLGDTTFYHYLDNVYPMAPKLGSRQPCIINGEYVTWIVRARVRKYVSQYWLSSTVDLKQIAAKYATPAVIKPEIVTSAAVKLNKQTMDLLTELAELPETVALARDTLGLFRNKGRKLNKVLHEIRDELSGGRSLAQLGDRIASARLLYRYGILPLSYTLKDIKAVLKESFKKQYAKAYYRQDSEIDMSWTGWSWEGTNLLRESCMLKRRLDPNSSIQQVQQVFGFNVPLTCWELTPWSLVVDWFMQVGDYLTAINVYPSLQDAGTYSVKRSISGSWTNNANSSQTVECKIEYYDRVTINYRDHLILQSNIVLNSARKMDAIAFSWQVIRSGIQKFKHS